MNVMTDDELSEEIEMLEAHIVHPVSLRDVSIANSFGSGQVNYHTEKASQLSSIYLALSDIQKRRRREAPSSYDQTRRQIDG